MSTVITAVQLDRDDLHDFYMARNALQSILHRKLDAVWTFKDKAHPDLQFEGVHFLLPEDLSGY